MTTLQLIPFLSAEVAEVAAFGVKAIRTIETVGLIGGEVFTAGAILWALNGLSVSIEKTYNAGKAVGRVYFAHVKPVLDLIDWAEVTANLWHACLVVGVAFFVAGEKTRQAFEAWHADWIGSIDWSMPKQPVFEPITCTFDGLNVTQLRKLARDAGIKKTSKMRKADLLLALA